MCNSPLKNLQNVFTEVKENCNKGRRCIIFLDRKTQYIKYIKSH